MIKFKYCNKDDCTYGNLRFVTVVLIDKKSAISKADKISPSSDLALL